MRHWVEEEVGAMKKLAGQRRADCYLGRRFVQGKTLPSKPVQSANALDHTMPVQKTAH